jgi:hypothetical protein
MINHRQRAFYYSLIHSLEIKAKNTESFPNDSCVVVECLHVAQYNHLKKSRRPHASLAASALLIIAIGSRCCH